jgi:D-3-phosphoglycerate dehydrogenase
VENTASRRFTGGRLSLGGPVVLDRFEDSLVVLHQNRYIEANMVDTVENLILDLLEWVGRREHTYQETMEVWRTTCPRLPVWEDATDRGLVETEHANGRSIVRVTPSGHALLKEHRSGSYEGLWGVRE